jgi:hypothetical protein
MTGEGPVTEALVEFAGTEVYNLEIIPAGDVTVVSGDIGIAERAGVGVRAEGVGTVVCIARGLSGSIHPAIVIIRIRKPIRKIPGYFIVYPHRLNIKNLMIWILNWKIIGVFL